MTLRKQIFWALSAIFLALVLLILLISVRGTRSYLESQLATHAQETATALSVTLAPSLARGDLVMAETQILSVFDRGYFKQITLLDVQKQVWLSKALPPRIEGVPRWFVSLLPIEPPTGEAFMSSGWRQLGKVVVASQPTFAYQHLWTNSVDLVVFLLAMYAVALGAAWWMLNLILRPLHAIEKTAIAIEAKRFEPIALLPRAPELRRVIRAMNSLSQRVAEMLKAEMDKASAFQREAYEDMLTGLANRRGYEVRLAELLGGHTAFDLAGIISVEIDDMRLLNRSYGFATGQRVMNTLVESALAALGPFPESIKARSNKYSFSFVLVDCSEATITATATTLRDHFMARMAGDTALAEIGVQVGVAFFSKAESRSSVFAKADLALETARQKERHGFHVLDNTPDANSALGSFAWRTLIQTALAEQRWKLVSQPVRSLVPDGPVLHREAMARLVDADGTLVPASLFMPMAARHRLMTDVDKAMFALAIDHLASTAADASLLAVNLSPQSLASPDFLPWLDTRLRSAGPLAQRLAIEAPEFGVIRNPQAAMHLRDVVRRHGGRFGMDHFGLDPQALQVLRDMVPDYVKLSGAFMDDIEHTDATTHLLAAFVSLAHSLDIVVIAQQLERQAQWQALRAAHVDAGQGYLFGAPE